jgi:NADH-quinone oxidoreductase subunit M
MLYERWHTRDLRELGGIWSLLPRLSGFTLLFALASLGLPGLANFIAEFLILAGAFQRDWPITLVALLGLVGAALYALLLVQRSLWGATAVQPKVHDCSPREWGMLASLALLLLVLGLHPQPVLDMVQQPVATILAEHAVPQPGGTDQVLQRASMEQQP